MRKITVPKGKEIRSIVGNYVFTGPVVITTNDNLKIPDTFTDGSKWFYDDEPEKPSEPTQEVIKNDGDVTVSTAKRPTQEPKDKEKKASKKPRVKD